MSACPPASPRPTLDVFQIQEVVKEEGEVGGVDDPANSAQQVGFFNIGSGNGQNTG